MKKILSILLLFVILAALGAVLTACGGDEECTAHIDTDCDNKCDTCGTDLTPAAHDCVDDNGDRECDVCGDEVEPPLHLHTDSDGDEVCDECGEEIPLDLTDLTVTKTSTHDRIRTVHPGEQITYTFTVTSTATEEKRVEILELIPGNTVYMSGDGQREGQRLVISLTVPAGTTVTASYSVAVPDGASRGETVASSSTIANGKAISSPTLYVGHTYNEHDMAKLVYALYAMRESEMQGKDLLTFHSRIAFSLNNAIADNADSVASALFLDTAAESSEEYAAMIVPGLYGGTSIGASHTARFVGTAADSMSINDIFPGDVLVILPDASKLDGARMYVTDGTRLFDITGRTTEVSVASVLDGISANDYFALLRPSLNSNNLTSFRSEPFYEGATDVERAIIATAVAYLLRGDKMQYADTRLVTSPAIYRWERGKSPEDYTVDETGYTNCTGFVHDVFYSALGYDYGSFTLANSPAEMKAYTYFFTGNESDGEKYAIEQEYRSALKVGDIVFYTYSGNTHAMLYIGNGNLVHATGSTYKDFTETEEATVRFQKLDCLFTPGNSRYVFQTENQRTALYIIRPLDTWQGSIPAESLNRLENMQGIVAEKLASYTLGQTVNRGDLITYTFKIFNANKTAVTLNITDGVPTGTALFVDGAVSSETALSWTVTVNPGEELLVSYTVRVSDTAEYGSAICCSDDSTVGGVAVKITPAYVGRTLTAEEQKRLVEIVSEMNTSGLSAVEVVNAVYCELFGVEAILGGDISDVKGGIFLKSGSINEIAASGEYAEMIAPSLYGGKAVDNSDRFAGERTRMPREKNLVVGDILYLQSTTSGYLYIYLGDGVMLDLQKFTQRDVYERLEETIGWQMFAILRPSLAITE